MIALLKAPTRGWEKIEIRNSGNVLRHILQGTFEVWDMNSKVAVLYNPLGREKGLFYNCRCKATEMYFYGPIMVVGLEDEKFRNIPDWACRILDRIGGWNYD